MIIIKNEEKEFSENIINGSQISVYHIGNEYGTAAVRHQLGRTDNVPDKILHNILAQK